MCLNWATSDTNDRKMQQEELGIDLRVFPQVLKLNREYEYLEESPSVNLGQLSHEKNPYYFPLYWLVNRDPYNGVL